MLDGFHGGSRSDLFEFATTFKENVLATRVIGSRTGTPKPVSLKGLNPHPKVTLLFLAVPDLCPHPSFLAADLATALTRSLGSHGVSFDLKKLSMDD